MSNDIGYAVNVIHADAKRYGNEMVNLLKSAEVKAPSNTQPSTPPAKSTPPASSGNKVDTSA